MEDIKKFEPVIFWQNGVMERGRILDVSLTDEGAIFYVENMRNHEMFSLKAEMVYKEKECK